MANILLNKKYLIGLYDVFYFFHSFSSLILPFLILIYTFIFYFIYTYPFRDITCVLIFLFLFIYISLRSITLTSFIYLSVYFPYFNYPSLIPVPDGLDSFSPRYSYSVNCFFISLRLFFINHGTLQGYGHHIIFLFFTPFNQLIFFNSLLFKTLLTYYSFREYTIICSHSLGSLAHLVR